MKRILNKLLLLAWFMGTLVLFAQPVKEPKPTYRKFRQEYKYTRHKNYPGPGRNFSSPVPMETRQYEYGDEDLNTLKYSPQQIQQSRQRRNVTGKGGSNGTKPFDPDVRKSPPVTFDPPHLKTPDIPAPGKPFFSPMFWKVLLFIIVFLLVAWIAYLVIRNYKPKDRPVSERDFSPADWNPELIPKTELELRLEAAMERGDYRECVRIYFTFILKELIRLRRIRWKRELTNIDYLVQLSGKDEYAAFEESVRIYDLVWYGEYEITQKEYESLVPHLEKNYQSLIATHE